MKKYRFKIDTYKSVWYKFAVYERFWYFWIRVYSSDSMDECEKFVQEALKLPKYYGANDA